MGKTQIMCHESFTIALEHHRCGRRRQAEQGYRSVLAENPRHADALHLLGVLAFQHGQLTPAAELINRAIEIYPQSAPFHTNLAEVYRAAGRLGEAVAAGYMALQLEPDNVEAHNNVGLALLAQQQFAQAESHFRDALRLRPDFAQAANNLGSALREQTRRDEALLAYREAVRLGPQNPESHNNLGQLLLEEGEVDEALVHCREALRLNPQFPEAHSNLGNVLRQQGQLDEAVACYQAALRLNPKLAMTYNNLGQACQEAAKFEEAIRWYQQALAKDPQNTRFHCNLASTLAEQEVYDQAFARYQLALRIDPTCLAAHNGLGHVYQEQGHLLQAIAAYRESLRYEPKQALAHISLGHLYQEQGDLAQAETCFRAALQQEPKAAGAYAGLATHHRACLSTDELATLRALLEEPGMRDGGRATIHFALAHLADADAEYPAAAEHMRLANTHRQADWQRRGKSYAPAAHQQFVDSLLATFTPDLFRRLKFAPVRASATGPDQRPARAGGLGLDSHTPVFIVGLPRSGTTLTEQILASHPQVHGAGELSLVRESFESLPAATGWDATPVECVARLASADEATTAQVLRDLAQRHLERLRTLGGDALRIVDKMPDNYVYLGWIVSMFPQARIIHCRRDVRDVALSCWLTDFKSIRWACTWEHITTRIEQYQRLSAHWQASLPVPLLEVDYEDTVTDLEGVARRLVAWAGLDWDPACLAFHETERPIRTASVSQVRQPIYTRSAGRWRNYERELAPLFTGLAAESSSSGDKLPVEKILDPRLVPVCPGLLAGDVSDPELHPVR
ncbi:MAG: tetratricopeptide repeat protein [Planctomycetota bacterium]|nr:tetratricopeptide repeat protein [Planctomycetota bacterium]